MFSHFIIVFSESQARSLLSSDLECRRGTLKSGEILNNEGSMDYHNHTGQLSITFRNMVGVMIPQLSLV